MFARIENNQIIDVVYSEVHIKTRQLPRDKYVAVVDKGRPSTSMTQYAVSREPKLEDGVPVLQYEILTKTPNALRKELKEVVANYRYNKETAGVTLSDSAKVPTDRNTQTALANVKVSFDAGLVTEVQWKTENGFITFDTTKLDEVISTVTTHVQSLFAVEKEVCDALDALTTVEELAAYKWRQHF